MRLFFQLLALGTGVCILLCVMSYRVALYFDAHRPKTWYSMRVGPPPAFEMGDEKNVRDAAITMEAPFTIVSDDGKIAVHCSRDMHCERVNVEITAR